MTARYSTSACRSCSRDRADSARVRSRSARPQIRPAVTATSVVSRSASANSPPDASVANHVTAVTPAPITSAIRAARMRRSGDRAGPDTGDVREPSSAVAMSQGDSVNSDSGRSQRAGIVPRRDVISPGKAVFLPLWGNTQVQHEGASAPGRRSSPDRHPRPRRPKTLRKSDEAVARVCRKHGRPSDRTGSRHTKGSRRLPAPT